MIEDGRGGAREAGRQVPVLPATITHQPSVILQT